MTRLELLRKEYRQIQEMRTLSFKLKGEAAQYFCHEIECIEKYGSPNPEYKDETK